MANTLQIKRGNRANLPTLADGELGLCLDTDQLFVGNGGSNLELATVDYANAIAQGLRVHDSVKAATTASLPACTYDNGTLGLGATLTGNSDGALPAQDGVTLSQGDRLLVKDQADPKQNGIYVVTQVGDEDDPFILTRASDADQASEQAYAFVFVSEGDTLGNTGWVCTNEPDDLVIGSTGITFSQFSSAGYISAGTGLTKVGNVMSVAGGLADIAGITPTKGNLLVGDGTNWQELGVGSDAQILTADSNEELGVKWADPADTGASTFVDLTDTPGNYTDAALKWLRVNSGADGLEFFEPKVGDLSDVDAFAGAGADRGKLVRVKTDSDALEFVPITTWLEDTPTENLQTKAPSSKWAYGHAAATTGVHGAGANTLLHSGSTIDCGTFPS